MGRGGMDLRGGLVLGARAAGALGRILAVTSIGLGSLTERDDTVRTVLRRSVAAIERLGFGDWLAGL